ncbi:uncharacterized protein HMPREF1541_01861 [Cyphellophora europaea CBS 101466]|uniref:Amine oxidase n=1 Tax=Cyphellophora europaea (strain CBS 101466) TaxID=1220924 RepID=W2S3T1_CYPE1|nr:uncharacterized protein HMPREF1541_01861 [Cyphellophora europaea CBS 101466]ETN42703.1 hypothetical protein HMPREF1541_01861 [Cyphellophora europaea CBS 101466]
MALQTRLVSCLLLSSLLLNTASSTPFRPKRQSSECRRTQVLVLGGGLAGVTAAQTLANNSIDDFVIVEYNNDLGGRIAHTTFGEDQDGNPYTVELGANWVQGIENEETGAVNPIWLLAQKYNITNTYSNYSSIETFNETGPVDFSDLLDEIDVSYTQMQTDTGRFILDNIQDYSVRSGLSLAGWKPKKDAQKQAVEWWYFDWEYSWQPEVSSAMFSMANYNTTFYQWSDENNFVWDSRGFNTIVKGEASEFLNCTTDSYDCSNDDRLLLNTIVTNLTYSDEGVIVLTEDGTCLEADFAICTFSLGVLQNEVVTFEPQLPEWKTRAINTFQMGTYTKIFMQFPPDQVFWDTDTQFFLYADPRERGYYPVFQSLDGPGFINGSGILFVTVVQDQSYTAEAQGSNVTEGEVMEVLRKMYGQDIPDPTAFMYPTWSLEPWTYGCYSNWPQGTTLEQHANLRANLDRLYFAGEATHPEYYGFLQAAYYEGQTAAQTIVDCLKGNDCQEYPRYEVLHGTTGMAEYNATNGWTVSSFQGYPPDS